MSFLHAGAWIAVRIPLAAVPDQHSAAAVLSLRDGSLEFVVLDRVVLHLDRETLLARHEARAARHGPALHHAVELEPQVVMQPARRMLLDDERIALGTARAAARLRGDVELTLLVICLQAHGRRPSARALEFLAPSGAANPMAGLAVDDVETHAIASGRRRKQCHRTGHERQLEVPLPIRARRHDATHPPWQTTKNAPGERPVPPTIAEQPRRVKHFAPFPLWPCHPCWLNSSQAGRLPR